MTLSLRRTSALALAGVVATAPLWLAVAANAADQVVTFSGTPDITESAVSCPSKPDRATLSVNPGQTVDFVNQLGVRATLTSSTGHRNLDVGEMVPVTFAAASAPISIQMLPHCPLDVGVHDILTVTVLAPSGGPSASTSASASVSAAPLAPSATPGRIDPSTPPKHRGPTKDAPRHQATPSRSPLVAGAGNGADVDPPSPSATPEPPGAMLFGTPVSARPASGGASGLLTLIATVSVGGVTAAVIRAIVAHRATRSLIR